MSGRNNEREQRARERERLRHVHAAQHEAHVMNALRVRALNGAGQGGGGQNNNEGDNDGGARPRGNVEAFAVLDLVATPRASASGGGNQGVKRKFSPAMYGPESVESWASTELEQETFAFLWTLKGYASFSSNTDEVKSPTFKGGPKSNHQWQLKMNPRKKMEELEYFAVHLILTGFGDADTGGSRRLKVRFQISLLDTDGKPGKQAGSATMSVCEFKKFSVWGYDKFLLSQDITSATRRLVDNDTLKIHCRIWIEGEVKHCLGVGGASHEIVTEDDIKRRRFQLLSNNFSELLHDTVFSDVALSTETRTFMAHKAVLASRSSVFKAMLSSGMLESAQNTVEINDFDEEVVNGMLEYMYTGETAALNEKAPDLMQIAEKYDLSGLKEDCEHAIAANLTVDNCAEILVLAHLHNASQLKPKVIEFINRNKTEVRRTQSFQQVALSNAAVFVDLYLSQ